MRVVSIFYTENLYAAAIVKHPKRINFFAIKKFMEGVINVRSEKTTWPGRFFGSDINNALHKFFDSEKINPLRMFDYGGGV